MSRSWVPDGGWTGHWEVPAVLRSPLGPAERATLVARSCAGMGPARMATWLSDATAIDADPAASSALEHLGALGGRAVVPSDDEYPACLREIDAPPLLLFVRGTPLAELAPCVAVIGSRACTQGAATFTHRLAAELARAGFTVVSGLARGIDGAAHEGALTEGRSIAVLGTGPDICYPAEHRDLAARIAASGALVTEFPPGIGPRAWHFPARNRMISGLSVAVIVVEAGLGSGALITAGFALDQGRGVFACTTGPSNPAGDGVRAMLRDGAEMIVDEDQAVEELKGIAGTEHGFELRPVPPRPRLDLDGDAAAVYEAITEDTSTDTVVDVTGLTVERVSTVLSALELDGALARGPGDRWRRI